MRHGRLGLMVVLAVLAGDRRRGSRPPAPPQARHARQADRGLGQQLARVSWPAPHQRRVPPVTIYLVTPYLGTKGAGHARVSLEGDFRGRHRSRERQDVHVPGRGAHRIGTGKQWVASKPVTIGVPAAPLALTASPGNAEVTVSWHHAGERRPRPIFEPMS